MTLQIILCALTILSCILFIVLRVKRGGLAGIISKTFASFMFVAYGLFSLTTVTYFNPTAFCFIILGLICGLIGDILLDLKVVYSEHNNTYLNCGMFAFGLGHIFYFAGAILYTGKLFNLLWPILTGLIVAITLTPIIYLITKKMGLNFGKFLWQSLAYTFILLFMSGFSIYLSCLAQEFIIFAGGILLIFISDLVLSLNYFGENKQNDKFLIIVNHALYYAGQILIATFLFLF